MKSVMVQVAMLQLDVNGAQLQVLPPQDEDDTTQVRVRVRVRDLLIHPKAQRDLRPDHVKELKKGFDIQRMVVHAVRYPREGGLPTLVVDGQHSYHAAMELGLGDKFITMIIHSDIKNDPCAHALFLLLNFKKEVAAFAKYYNQLGAERANVVEIEAVLASYGLRVHHVAGEGVLRCPAALARVHKRLGRQMFRTVFEIIEGAYHFSEDSLEGTLLDGISQVLRGCGSKVDIKRMIDKLQRRGNARQLMGYAKARNQSPGRVARNLALLIIEEYNVGLRTDDRRLVFRLTREKAPAPLKLQAAS